MIFPGCFFFVLKLKSFIQGNFFFTCTGRYSPVRRASEGSKINAPFQGVLQECQQLQKATQPRHLLVAQSPPLADNSVSLPGNFLTQLILIFMLFP